MLFQNYVISELKRRKNIIGGKYICAHVRNTDINCDYEMVLQECKERKQKEQNIYVCSDNREVIEHFQREIGNIYNFTTFPEKKQHNLHYSNLDGKIKLMDTLADLYIMSCSEEILSNSKGCYILLARACHNNKMNELMEN